MNKKISFRKLSLMVFAAALLVAGGIIVEKYDDANNVVLAQTETAEPTETGDPVEQYGFFTVTQRTSLGRAKFDYKIIKEGEVIREGTYIAPQVYYGSYVYDLEFYVATPIISESFPVGTYSIEINPNGQGWQKTFSECVVQQTYYWYGSGSDSGWPFYYLTGNPTPIGHDNIEVASETATNCNLHYYAAEKGKISLKKEVIPSDTEQTWNFGYEISTHSPYGWLNTGGYGISLLPWDESYYGSIDTAVGSYYGPIEVAPDILYTITEDIQDDCSYSSSNLYPFCGLSDWMYVYGACSTAGAQTGFNLYSRMRGSVGGISVLAGEETTCHFTNIYERNDNTGTIEILKKAPDGPADKWFDFNINGPTDASTAISYFYEDSLYGNDIGGSSISVQEGEYEVSELIQEGWELTDVRCITEDGNLTGAADDEGGISDVVVEAGKTTTCLFRDKWVGQDKLIIYKETTENANNTTFNFPITKYDSFLEENVPAGSASVQVSDYFGESQEIWLDEGTYTILEESIDSWELTDVFCVDEDEGEEIDFSFTESGIELDIDPSGKTIYCAFLNEYIGDETNTLTIEKYTEPIEYEDCDPATEECACDPEFEECLEEEPTIFTYWVIPQSNYVEGQQVDVEIEYDEEGGGFGSATVEDLDPEETYEVYEDELEGWQPVEDPNYPACYLQDETETGTQMESEDYFGVEGVEIDNTTCQFWNEWVGAVSQGLIIAKEAVGGDDTFTFYRSGVGNFEIETEDGYGATDLIPMEAETTVDIAELESDLPDGWTFDSVYCEDNNSIPVFFEEQEGNPMSIFFTIGEGITTCTFKNTYGANTLTIEKYTEPIEYEDCDPATEECACDPEFEECESTVFSYMVISDDNSVEAIEVDVEITEYDEVGVGYGFTTLTAEDGIDPTQTYSIYESELNETGWQWSEDPYCQQEDSEGNLISYIGWVSEEYFGMEGVGFDTGDGEETAQDVTCAFTNEWVGTPTLTIEKYTEPMPSAEGGEEQQSPTFTYFIYSGENYVLAQEVQVAVEYDASNPGEGDLGWGKVVITDLEPGQTYHVYEEPLEGWAPVETEDDFFYWPYCWKGDEENEDYTGETIQDVPYSAVENVEVNNTTCTFWNEPVGITGIKMVKKVSSATGTFSPQVFSFTTNFDPSSFSLTATSGEEVFQIFQLPASGDYVISEVMPLPQGWELMSASCDDEEELSFNTLFLQQEQGELPPPLSAGALFTQQAQQQGEDGSQEEVNNTIESITVTEGHLTTCTFENVFVGIPQGEVLPACLQEEGEEEEEIELNNPCAIPNNPLCPWGTAIRDRWSIIYYTANEEGKNCSCVMLNKSVYDMPQLFMPAGEIFFRTYIVPTP